MRRQQHGLCAVGVVLLLSGLGGCGGDASSGWGGIGIGGVAYDDDDTPVGLRGSMEGISPLTIGRNCTDAGCAIVDHEGATRFRIEFNLAVSCESDPNNPCVAE